MIEAKNLTKKYGDKTAVDDLTFTVQPGLITGFLGPNGAGKSTTMRMILGLDTSTGGTVTGSSQLWTAQLWSSSGATPDGGSISTCFANSETKRSSALTYEKASASWLWKVSADLSYWIDVCPTVRWPSQPASCAPECRALAADLPFSAVRVQGPGPTTVRTFASTPASTRPATASAVLGNRRAPAPRPLTSGSISSRETNPAGGVQPRCAHRSCRPRGTERRRMWRVGR